MVNYMYNIVVIGGGISGLYVAYKLSEKYTKITIIEKNTKLGGRINTIYKNNYSYEAGASRISQNHTFLLNLIKEIGLENDLYKLKGEKIPNSLIVDDSCAATDNNNNTHNIKDLISSVIIESSKYNMKFLTKLTFIQLASLILSSAEVNFIKNTLGYEAELNNLNSFDALRIFEQDLNFKSDYYIVKSGFSKICDKLREILIDRGVEIQLDKTMIDYSISNDLFNIQLDDETIVSKNLILALPKNGLKNIAKINNTLSGILDTVNEIPLNRIYAKYPKNKDGDVWFKGLGKITLNTPMRFIIPINEKNGLIMISYTDSENAVFWDKINEYDLLDETIYKVTKEIFPDKVIPEPEYIKSYFWNNGIHFFKPGFNSEIINISKPFENTNLFIVGEAYSKHQGWVEGALDSVQSVLTYF